MEKRTIPINLHLMDLENELAEQEYDLVQSTKSYQILRSDLTILEHNHKDSLTNLSSDVQNSLKSLLEECKSSLAETTKPEFGRDLKNLNTEKIRIDQERGILETRVRHAEGAVGIDDVTGLIIEFN